jgi:hypothetical protein
VKRAGLVVAVVILLNVLSWAVAGKDRSLLATAQFYGEGCHGPEDSLLVFAQYRGVPDSVRQAGDFSSRTREAFIAEVRERRVQFLQRFPRYSGSEGIVEYRDAVGDVGAASESTARFVPRIDRSSFLSIEVSAMETLSDGSIYTLWDNQYWWFFGWRSPFPSVVGCA